MSFINEYKALGPAPEKTLRFFVSLPPPPPLPQAVSRAGGGAAWNIEARVKRSLRREHRWPTRGSALPKDCSATHTRALSV